jgi:hypothetical protein
MSTLFLFAGGAAPAPRNLFGHQLTEDTAPGYNGCPWERRPS